MDPKAIFVEKGFASREERNEAKKWLGKKCPAYIMCQHRYNSLLDPITSTFDIDNVIKCNYNWIIEKGEISEFLYHIASIDSYLRKTDTQIYHNETGKYTIDENSKLNIIRGQDRLLNIKLETKLYKAELNLGKENHLSLKNKETKTIYTMSSFREDFLGKMILDTLTNTKNKLERL
jgi:hypothetical protein